MSSVQKFFVIVAALGMLFFLAAPAVADWTPKDGHKMHYPQLPDSTGWDVNIMEPLIVADDWKCSESGPVSDIHGWVSVKGDGDLMVKSLTLYIYNDQPIGPSGHSQPEGDPIWLRTFYPEDLVVAGPFFGDQGWYDPFDEIIIEQDHRAYYQINVTDIERPFPQEEGLIYWLGVSAEPLGVTDTEVGWKTSLNHWNDDAVYLGRDGMWHEMYDPLTGESLDMAFVITPEPGTLALLVTAGLGLLLFAWRRRK